MSNINPSLNCHVSQDPRTVSIRCNLIPGYVTQRLEPRLPYYSLTNGASYAPAQNCVAIVRNRSIPPNDIKGEKSSVANAVVLQLQECNDYSPSGARTKLGNAVLVQPGGQQQITFTPRAQFFEVKGIAGNGPVTIDIVTKIDWNEVGFNQDLDSTFPSAEWATTDIASTTKSASQTFTSNTVWNVVHNLGYVATPTLLDTAGNDITSQATISAVTTNGYTATFGVAKAGTAYSTL